MAAQAGEVPPVAHTLCLLIVSPGTWRSPHPAFHPEAHCEPGVPFVFVSAAEAAVTGYHPGRAMSPELGVAYRLDGPRCGVAPLSRLSLSRPLDPNSPAHTSPCLVGMGTRLA